jgi:hypothetical protein
LLAVGILNINLLARDSNMTKDKETPKLTDAERHKRFVETAEKVEASEREIDFDEAFKSVARPKPSDSHPHPSDKLSSS